jgi:uncharacterized protein
MDPSSGKYLLSGASGMIGVAIRRGLSARQLEAVQLVRPARAARANQKVVGAQLASGHASRGSATLRSVAVSISGEVLWDAWAKPAVTHPELLEGVAAAVHLSGANVSARKWTTEYKREIESSRVDSTRALAETLAGLKRPPKTLLVASAVGIYGNRGDELLDEKSAPGSGFLAEVCQKWEAAAKPAVDAGIRVVHLRVGVALGPGQGALGKMMPIFQLGLGGRLGPGTQWMSWISLEDIVSAVFLLLDTPSIAGPVNLVAPNPVTNAEFTRALGHALHRPAMMPVPTAALRMMTGEMADEMLLASERAVPARLSAAGFEFAHPTIDKALGAMLAKR